MTDSGLLNQFLSFYSNFYDKSHKIIDIYWKRWSMHQHTVKICRHIESLISLSKGISMVFQEDRFYNINEEFRFFKYRTKMEKTRLDLKRRILYLTIIKLLKKTFVDIRDTMTFNIPPSNSVQVLSSSTKITNTINFRKFDSLIYKCYLKQVMWQHIYWYLRPYELFLKMSQ